MGLINAQRVSLFSLLNHFRTKGILHRSASTTGQRLMGDTPGVHVTAQAGFTEVSFRFPYIFPPVVSPYHSIGLIYTRDIYSG